MKKRNLYLFLCFTPSRCYVTCSSFAIELILEPSAYASGDYVHKRTEVEIERRCARLKPRMTSIIEHVCVYDVSFLFFYKNSLDFIFNLV